MTHKQISDLQTGIWLIGLAILFITGDWWPGILILIGISTIAGSILRARSASSPELPPAPPALRDPFEVGPVLDEPLPDPSPRAAPQPALAVPTQPPASASRPVDRLPENCDACGAPVRGTDVTWTGFDAARCGFCGSPLKMKTNS